MKFIPALLVSCVAAAGLAACDQQPEPAETAAVENETGAGLDQPEANLSAAEMPPMVVRSAAYRCDDGNALYVDVLSDADVVNVRDSRSDLPVRLERESADANFTGENRSLSGTGDEVRYAAPERPDQSCRAAEA